MNKVKIMSVKYYKLMSYVLFCMVLLNTSCDNIVDNRESPPVVTEGEDLIPVLLNLKGLFGDENNVPTYSLTDVGDQEGTGPENDINDVTVFVFNSSNVCEKILQKTTSPYDEIGPELVKTGFKTFITVVNGATNLPSVPYASYVPGQEALVSYNGLRQMLSKAITEPPVAPFLMTDETTATLSLREISTPNEVDLNVKRAVAKVKFYITKDDKALSHTITMTRITLHNGANQVCLLQEPMNSTVSYTVSSLPKTAFTLSGDVPDKLSGNYCQLVDTFYTYESLAGLDKSKAVYFELEAAVNSSANIRKARVYLAENPLSTTDTLYNVYRNYWYNVYVNILDPGMDSVYVTVKSAPWNLADIQEVTPGSGYDAKPSEPFKLVKNYTVGELTLSSGNGAFAAIEKHSKGQAYIDLKVTDGVRWKLEFQSATGENAGAKMAFGADSADWTAKWETSLELIGDDNTHRIWIYRPYVENAEPESGPTLTLMVGDQNQNLVPVRDFVVQPRDTTPIPTNCYIMRPQLTGTPQNETRAYIPLAGVYRYWEDYIYSNGDSIPAGNVSWELLWEDSPGVIKSPSVSVINADKRDQAYLYVEAGSVQGNAVVAMKVNNTIYWSFHLWVTEYNPYEAAGQKFYIGNIFMDRNLGAQDNKYDNNDAHGLYYQFGRKDPFRPLSVSPVIMSAGVSVLRPLVAIPTSLQNPETFYSNPASWPLSVENGHLWNTSGNNKTAFDPCPEGWRIPKQESLGDTYSPWNGLNAGNFSVTGSNNGRYHTAAGYYPFAGYIVNGTVNPTSTFFWTSYNASDGANGGGLGINNILVTVFTDINKSTGASVRCVVDVNYLKNAAGGGLFGKSAGDMKDIIIP
jgi:hypothetical protein